MPGPGSARPFGAQHRLNEAAAERAYLRGDTYAHHRPLSVYLQVASGCNIECYMCIEQLRPVRARRGRDLKSLPREVFDKLCAQVFPYSSRLHIGLGGEPSLSPDFQYFIERGFECGQRVDLTTNGTRLDQPGLAAALARCVTYLQVSIDGATRETYERIRVGSSWTRLRANLDRLNEHRLNHAPGERTRLSLCFVLMKSNLHELPAFVELAAQLHAEEVRAQHVIPTTEAGKPESLIDDQQRYNDVLEAARLRAVELGVHLDAPRPYPSPTEAAPRDAAPLASTPASSNEPPATARRRSIECRLPTQHLFITYEGRVMPCCHPHANVKMKAGDLLSEDFDAIWNNAQYRALRGSLHDGDLHPICRTCSIAQNPPPAPEDPEMLRSAPTLAEWAADRHTTDDSASERPLADLLARAGVLDYLNSLESERDGLQRHAANLEAERPHLLQHIANIESERNGLRRHVENLEALRNEPAPAAAAPAPAPAEASAPAEARAGWLDGLLRRSGSN